jgi:hypothetical protein
MHEICSTCLAVREMQIKTTFGFHLTLVRMATIKKTNNSKCWQGSREKKKSSSTVGGNLK